MSNQSITNDVHDTIAKTPDETDCGSSAAPQEVRSVSNGTVSAVGLSSASTKDDGNDTRVDGIKVIDSTRKSAGVNGNDPTKSKTAMATSAASGAAWGSVAVKAKAGVTVVSPQKMQENAEHNGNSNSNSIDIASNAAGDGASHETTTLEGLLPADAVTLVWKRLRLFAQSEGLTGARALFQRFDIDKSGILDPKEFKAALAHVGLPGASNKVVEIVMKAASQGDGAKGSKKVLDYSSFAVALQGGPADTNQPISDTKAIVADVPATRVEVVKEDLARKSEGALDETVTSAALTGAPETVEEAVAVSEGVATEAEPAAIEAAADAATVDNNGGNNAGDSAAAPEKEAAAAIDLEAQVKENYEIPAATGTSTTSAPGGAGMQLEGMAPDDAVKVVWEKLQALIDDGNHGNALELFQAYDADNSGTLDTKEFKAALAAVGLPGASNKVVTQVMKTASSGEHSRGTKKLLYYDDFLNAITANSRTNQQPKSEPPTSQGDVSGRNSQAEPGNVNDVEDSSLQVESHANEEMPAESLATVFPSIQDEGLQKPGVATTEENSTPTDNKELPSHDSDQGLGGSSEVKTEEPAVESVNDKDVHPNPKQGLEESIEVRTEELAEKADVTAPPASLENGSEESIEVGTEEKIEQADTPAPGAAEKERIAESDDVATECSIEDEDEDIFGVFSAPKETTERPAFFAGSPSREESHSAAESTLLSPPVLMKELAPFEESPTNNDGVAEQKLPPDPVSLSPPQTSGKSSQENTRSSTTPSPPLKSKPKTGLSMMRSAYAELVQRGDDSPASAGMASPLSSPTAHRPPSAHHHQPLTHHPPPSSHHAHNPVTTNVTSDSLGSPWGDLTSPSVQAPAKDMSLEGEDDSSMGAPVVVEEVSSAVEEAPVEVSTAAAAPVAQAAAAITAMAAAIDAPQPGTPPLSPSKGPTSPAWGRVASPTKKNSTSGISPSSTATPFTSPPCGQATTPSSTHSPAVKASSAASSTASVVAAFKTAKSAKLPPAETTTAAAAAAAGSASPTKKLPTVKSGGVAARWAAARKAAEEERAAEEAAANAAKAAEVVDLARKAKLAAEATARARVEEQARQKAQREAKAQASRKAMLEQATNQRKATEEAETRRVAEAAEAAKRAAAEERASLVKAGKEDAAKRQALQDAAEVEKVAEVAVIAEVNTAPDPSPPVIAKEGPQPAVEEVALAPTVPLANAVASHDDTPLPTSLATVTEEKDLVADIAEYSSTAKEVTNKMPVEGVADVFDGGSQGDTITSNITSAGADSGLNDDIKGAESVEVTMAPASSQDTPDSELHAAPESPETITVSPETATTEVVYVEEHKDNVGTEIASEPSIIESKGEEARAPTDSARSEGWEVPEGSDSAVETIASTEVSAVDATKAEAETGVEIDTAEQAETKAEVLLETSSAEVKAVETGEESEALVVENLAATTETTEAFSRPRSTSLPAPPTPPRGMRRRSLDPGAPPPDFVPPLPKVAINDTAATVASTPEKDASDNSSKSEVPVLSPASLAQKASSNGGVTTTEVMEALTGSAFLKLDLRARIAVLSPLPTSAFALDSSLHHTSNDSAQSSEDSSSGESSSLAKLPRYLPLADQASLLLALPLPLDRAACLLGLSVLTAAALALEFRLRCDYTEVVPLLGRSAATAVMTEINRNFDLFGALLPAPICQNIPRDTGARFLACRSPRDLAALLLALPAGTGADLFAEMVRRDSQVAKVMDERPNQSSRSTGESSGGPIAALTCAIRIDPSRAGALVASVQPFGIRGAPLRAHLLMAALRAMHMPSLDGNAAADTASDSKADLVSANSLGNDTVAQPASFITRQDAIAAFLPEDDRAAFKALSKATYPNTPLESAPTLLENNEQSAFNKSRGGSGKRRDSPSSDTSLVNSEAAVRLRARFAKTEVACKVAQEAVNAVVSVGGGSVCGPDGKWQQLAGVRAAKATRGGVAEEVRAQHVLAPGNQTCSAVAVLGSVAAWRFRVMATNTAQTSSQNDDSLHVDSNNNDGDQCIDNVVVVPLEWVPTRIRPCDREEPLSNTTYCSSISESISREDVGRSDGGGLSDDYSDTGKSKTFFGVGDDYAHGDEPSLDDLFDDDEDDENAVATSRAPNRRGQSGIRSSLELDGGRNDGREGLDAVDWRFRRDDSDDESEDQTNQSTSSDLAQGAPSSNGNSSRGRKGVEAWGAWAEDPTSPLDEVADDADSPTTNRRGREEGKSALMVAAAPRRPPSEPPGQRPVGKLAAAFAAVSADQDDANDETSAAESSKTGPDNTNNDTTPATPKGGGEHGNEGNSSGGANHGEDLVENNHGSAEALLGLELEKDWVEGLTTIDEGDDDDDDNLEQSPLSSSTPKSAADTAAAAAADAAAAGFETAFASGSQLPPTETSGTDSATSPASLKPPLPGVDAATAPDTNAAEQTAPLSPDSPPRRLLDQALNSNPSQGADFSTSEVEEDRHQSRGLSLDRRPLPSSPPQQQNNHPASPPERRNSSGSNPVPPIERRPSASELAVSAADAVIAEAAALEAYYAEQAEADDHAAAAAAAEAHIGGAAE